MGAPRCVGLHATSSLGTGGALGQRVEETTIPPLERRTLFGRSTVPGSIVGGAGPLFYGQGRRGLCQEVVHERDEAVMLERLGQKRERSPLAPMAGQFLIGMPRHQDDAKVVSDRGGAPGQFMTVEMRELGGR